MKLFGPDVNDPRQVEGRAVGEHTTRYTALVPVEMAVLVSFNGPPMGDSDAIDKAVEIAGDCISIDIGASSDAPDVAIEDSGEGHMLIGEAELLDKEALDRLAPGGH